MSRSDKMRGDSGGVEVFCGVDVARETHYAVAVDRAGRRLADRPLPNDETALRGLFTELAGHARLLVAVDQPASIGTPRSWCCACGCRQSHPRPLTCSFPGGEG